MVEHVVDALLEDKGARESRSKWLEEVESGEQIALILLPYLIRSSPAEGPVD